MSTSPTPRRRPIDHGAALYFAHSWPRADHAATAAHPRPAEHVLLGAAGPLEEVHARLAPLLTGRVLRGALAAVPDEWLAGEPGFADADAVWAAYVAVLGERLAAHERWLPTVEVARVAR